ncbi:MAG: YhbY family RNA-binding protein [Archangiaceae bacterium]|nr:YhbY family RNA-binding protein [Archangiaceae bacterium]
MDDRKPRPKRKKQGELSGKQRRELRALGHHLKVVIQVGQQGVTDPVIDALDDALETHELVKAQIADEREARATAAKTLAQATSSVIAQEMGKTVLFFRKREKKSKFESL